MQGEHTEPGALEPDDCEGTVSKTRLIAGAAAVLLLALLYWALSDAGMLPSIADERQLKAQVDAWGAWGPLLLILLMTAAIVMSPIPSGPIALVAGAAYGPLLGTIYTVVGAEAGAVIAFWISRCLGYETLRCWPTARRFLEKLGDKRSQTRLMAAVFLSRLVPFISFDAVSYVAGLTPLTFWRFAIATLAGVVPVSFALAYFGDQMIAADSERIVLFVLLIGGITVAPFAVKMLLKWRRSQRPARSGSSVHPE